MIVDTCYLLDLLGGNRAAFEKGERLTDENVPLKVPTMTIVELFVGYGATENEEEARRVENAILGHPILPLTSISLGRPVGSQVGRDSITVMPPSVRRQSTSTNRC